MPDDTGNGPTNGDASNEDDVPRTMPPLSSRRARRVPPVPPEWVRREANDFDASWRDVAEELSARYERDEHGEYIGPERRHGAGRRTADTLVAKVAVDANDITRATIAKWGKAILAVVAFFGTVGGVVLAMFVRGGWEFTSPNIRLTETMRQGRENAVQIEQLARHVASLDTAFLEMRFGNCLGINRSDPAHLPASCYAVLRMYGVPIRP